MKQALILVDEINRKLKAIDKTGSSHLTVDYSKSVKNDLRELKMYCEYRDIDLKALVKRLYRPKNFNLNIRKFVS